MRFVKAGFSGVVLVVLVFTLNTRFGAIPPVAKFFDPDAGFWANAETSVPESEELNLPGLRDEVTVYFDDRRVPHIFAGNDHDLYMTQGYLAARDRLFQMEIQTYDAAGRLSEIIGPAMLERDRSTRRWGMPYGAEKALEEIKKDSATWNAISAYSDGVNAWIENLRPKDYPLEYKILDFAPEEWKPVKTALLLKNMSRTLAGSSSDDQTSNTMKYFGEDFIEKWFTVKPELTDPIIPPSREWNFDTNISQPPETLYVPASAKEIAPFQTPEGIGSNNWAVSGSKTKSGYPILANDPHLGLTLPSIWYEAQLHAPGVNTYGVSLQGAPGIIIGFNEHVAWGSTNVSADVMDWYEIKFKDDSKKEYWYDGQWKPATFRIEEIKARGEDTVIDTVVYTHHGPVTEVSPGVDEERDPVYHAQRWIAHDGSNEMKTFYGLNRARNYDDYVEALSYFDAPAQNFVFASKEGDIALWVNGKFPNKWKHQGRTVSDGADPKYDWQGWIPRDHVPHIKNPDRGFVSSANQEPAAEDYPYYMEDDYAPFERGRRINDLLAQMDDISPKDMQEMQMDDFSYYAATLLPSLLEWVNTDGLNEREKEAFEVISNWDYYMEAEEIAPSIFRYWRGNFYESIFDDEYESTQVALRYPSRDRFVEVIKAEPGLSFIDDINTPEKESREERATFSFKKTVSEMVNEYGAFGESWKWGYLIDNDINHIAYIPGLGSQDLFSSGDQGVINATRGSQGPSWRMVVELGEEVKGWGVYPGGASGNPGSPSFDSMVETWRKGQYYELNFYKEAPAEFLYRFRLNSSN